MPFVEKRFIIVLLFFVTVQISFSQKIYFPDSSWQIRPPAERKLNAALIDSAVRYALQNEVNMEYDLRNPVTRYWDP
jgi:hypothetical protein